MSKTIVANRSELLNVKYKINTTKKGYSLLKKKRDGLILEFFKLIKIAKDLRGEMDNKFKLSKKTLYNSRIIGYDSQIKLIAKTCKKRDLINFQTKNIMGLSVPKIKALFSKRNIIQRNISVYSSASLNEAVKSYDELVEKIIIVAEIETAILGLLKEIEKTKRRVNGIEFRILPTLKTQEDFIKFSLDEQDREKLIALKKVKKNIERKTL